MPVWRSFRFARNLGWNVLGQLGGAAVSFFLLPYLIKHMGLETYALYILLFTVINYMSLVSFGAASAVIKYVAAYCASANGTGLRDVLRYGTIMSVLGTLLGMALLGFGARLFAVRLFHVPAAQAETAVFVLRCAAAAALFISLTQLALAVMQTMHRFDYYNLIGFLQTGLMSIGTALLLAAGRGIMAVACWYVALSAAICAVSVALSWRLLRPTLRMPGKGAPFGAFATFSLSQWFGTIPALILGQSDRVLIARGDSLSGLTLYSAPAGFIQRLQIIPSIICAVVTPTMVELHEQKDEESLKRIYIRTVRFIFWMGLPLLVLLFSLMPQFLTLWLGVEFGGRSVWPMRLLVVMQALALLVSMPNTIAFSREKPWKNTQMAWTHMLLALLLWKFMIPRLHLLGIALGALIAQIPPVFVLVNFVHGKLIRISPREFCREALLAPGVSAALVFGVVFPLHPLVTTWTRLLMLGALGGAVYYVSTWFLLNPEDRQTVRNYLRWESPL